MTKEELEKATGQELIEQRDYCGVDGYYGDYLDDVNAEMLKRFNRLAELEEELEQTEKDLADYQFNYPTIKELEKENADLKEEINKIAFARGNLEEENAELKEKVNILDNCDRLGDVITEEYKGQLTKAKELLERLLVTSCNSDVLNLLPNCSEVLKVRVEAEQFLSEVEK